MRSARFDYLLAGTAVALTLSLTSYCSSTFAATEAELSAAVPMPAIADLPPPTAGDVAPSAKSIAQPASQAAKPAGEVTASVPASVGAKATALAAADTAIVEKLRDQLTAGKFDRILGGKKDRGAVEGFYVGRDFAPLWITDGAMNVRAKAAVDYLTSVEADGLDPADYPIPEFRAGAEPEALAEAEIRLTDSVLTFARHAMGGRVHYSRVAGDIIYDLARPDPANVLSRIANAKDARTALDSLNPPQPQYQALKAKLAELRHGPKMSAKAEENRPEPARVHVPDGKTLNQGMSDPRVIAVRKRLNVEGDKDSPLFDDAVLIAIKTFQTEADLTVDGVLGPIKIGRASCRERV